MQRTVVNISSTFTRKRKVMMKNALKDCELKAELYIPYRELTTECLWQLNLKEVFLNLTRKEFRDKKNGGWWKFGMNHLVKDIPI